LEITCTGCGICPRKCPFKAITIINTPERLDDELIHRYGDNGFTLFRLPVMNKQAVTGLIGQNGIGKSTALKILSGEMKPNFGRTDVTDPEVEWREIIDFFKGTESQFFFERMRDEKLKCVRKPQYIENIPRKIEGSVKDVFDNVDEREVADEVIVDLGLDKLLKREIKKLSGGELQKLAVGVALCREADIYLFDEPSSFLDVRERIKMAMAIRKLKQVEKTVLVVEHDLAILDYLSDYTCIFYGQMGAYGIVSNVHNVRDGINHYLEGFLPDENMRFRPERIKISKTSIRESVGFTEKLLEYKDLEKHYDSGFHLSVLPGDIYNGQIIGILGPNGIGKSTFVKMIAGIEKIDKGEIIIEDSEDNDDGAAISEIGEEEPVKKLSISYKPQYLFETEGIDPDQKVWDALYETNKTLVSSSWFKSEVIKPLQVEMLFDQRLQEISGGELQKVLVTLSLAKNADLYLLDEPSAYLSVEDRLRTARVIQKYIQRSRKAAFIVDHDIVLQDYVSDLLQVFLGRAGFRGKAYTPTGLETGMNRFLANISITFRRDPISGRPRVNKTNSKLDKKQRQEGRYYYGTL
jgi:ATP-binding cassette subfamily E protein 1